MFAQASRLFSARKRQRNAPAHPHLGQEFYQQAYETHAQSIADDSVIGGGEFDLVGRLELSALVLAGLRPTSTLLDFGCGVGRLAVHAIPFLHQGAYIGLEISQNLLDRAKSRCRGLDAPSEWILEAGRELPSVPDRSLDFVGAFSVFTHIEPEDSLEYLRSFRRAIRTDGKLVASLLLIEENGQAREIFAHSSSLSFSERYSRVRNVVTTKTMFQAIAELPSRDALIGKLLFLMQYPISGLAVALDAIRKQKEDVA